MTIVAGDRLHPQSEAIYAVLEKLARQMKEAGYVPNTNFVLHDFEEELKEKKNELSGTLLMRYNNLV